MKISIYPEIPQKLKKEIAKCSVYCVGIITDDFFKGTINIPPIAKLILEKYVDNIQQAYIDIIEYVSSESKVHRQVKFDIWKQKHKTKKHP